MGIHLVAPEPGREPSLAASGDHGPWSWLVPTAWQLASDPGGSASVPVLDPREDDLDTWIAWWSPLLHLTTYGLGWSRTDLGIARWLALGRPTDDPLLALIDRWWGMHISDVVSWGLASTALLEFGQRVATELPRRSFDETPLDGHAELPRLPSGRSPLAGAEGDPLHIAFHALFPATYDSEAQVNSWHHADWRDPDGGEHPRAMTLIDTYRPWYATFWHYHPTEGPNGRTFLTDVIVKPVGWLGAYRWSRETGAWFRGRHRWHMLGN